MSEGAVHASARALYDDGLEEVYGYLLHRCGSVQVAEDLTSETFLAAVAALRKEPAPLNVAWLIGVARHKLVDHWRRQERQQRALRAVEGGAADDATDPWPGHLDVLVATRTLAQLGPHHRSALTLRYVDDLSVREVARLLERTEAATEQLLARARAAFRHVYERGGADAD